MGEIKWGEDGLIVINSKFGWLLFGLINGVIDCYYILYVNLIIESYKN